MYTTPQLIMSNIELGGASPPPKAPVISVSAETDNSITVDVAASLGADYYVIEYKESSNGSWLVFNSSASSGANTITGLTHTTDYDIRAKAVSNTNGSSGYNTLYNIPTDPPL